MHYLENDLSSDLTPELAGGHVDLDLFPLGPRLEVDLYHDLGDCLIPTPPLGRVGHYPGLFFKMGRHLKISMKIMLFSVQVMIVTLLLTFLFIFALAFLT